MLVITPDLTLDENEINESFVRAAGPGGRNVNKVATAVQLRFDVRHSPSLPEPVRERLIRLAGSRISTDGILVIQARRYRTQEQNRADAWQRLTDLLRQAAEPPKPRRPTRPTRASKTRRLESKRRHSLAKRSRRSVTGSDS